MTVHDGKGAQDRVTGLPQAWIEPLQRQLAKTRALHEEELAEGYGEGALPYAFDRKEPGAAPSWATRMSPPRWSIRMGCSVGGRASAARSIANSRAMLAPSDVHTEAERLGNLQEDGVFTPPHAIYSARASRPV
jgi:hypothetical protein